MKSFVREVLITAILAIAIFVVAQGSIQTFVVIGQSMEPNFDNGERLIVNKAIYYFRSPQRGEVIVFEPPNVREGDYIKRVIGLPGDTVEIKKGKVYINGSPIDEIYITNQADYTLPQQKIPENSYFVLGDNRDNSNDSHNGWVVPRRNVVGKAWLCIWPPTKWGLMPSYPLQKQLVNSMAR